MPALSAFFRAGRAAVALLLLIAAAPAEAEPCRSESFDGTDYTICSFDLRTTDMRIFWRDGQGRPFATFDALGRDLAGRGETLGFAMNGGMYGDDLSPIGLLIQEGREIRRANTADAPQLVNGQPPNFYRKPNGIFYLSDDEAGVLETGAFLNVRPETAYATQSGPMLLIAGAIHPDFIEGSTDRKPRNGVGVSGPHQVHFAISEERVNFHDFARLFRDRLGCRDALFLDGGTAPGLYSPELGRNDRPGHGGYGPIIGVVGPAG